MTTMTDINHLNILSSGQLNIIANNVPCDYYQ